jgi:hypothetical protein
MVDSRTVELTANDNTPYTWFWVDLHGGPLVMEAPPKVLGLADGEPRTCRSGTSDHKSNARPARPLFNWLGRADADARSTVIYVWSLTRVVNITASFPDMLLEGSR